MRRMTGNELRQRRKAVGVSQAKFAELTGVSQHRRLGYGVKHRTLNAGHIIGTCRMGADAKPL